jgi:hypothetical protein
MSTRETERTRMFRTIASTSRTFGQQIGFFRAHQHVRLRVKRFELLAANSKVMLLTVMLRFGASALSVTRHFLKSAEFTRFMITRNWLIIRKFHALNLIWIQQQKIV